MDATDIDGASSRVPIEGGTCDPVERHSWRTTMWRMNSGDRVLSEAEWNLFRVGLEMLWDYIEDDSDEDAGLSETGIRVFDVLQPEQKLALLADVGQALRDPAIPAPDLTAANEGAI